MHLGVLWRDGEIIVLLHSTRWSWFSLSSLVWWGGDTFSLNGRQTGLFCKLVWALWPQSLLKLVLTFKVTPFYMLKFSTHLKGDFCKWVVGSYWDVDTFSLLLLSIQFACLHLCNSSRMSSFSKFCLTRTHTQISSLVPRERVRDEIQACFGVGCRDSLLYAMTWEKVLWQMEGSSSNTSVSC